jgi:hypothetical protein
MVDQITKHVLAVGAIGLLAMAAVVPSCSDENPVVEKSEDLETVSRPAAPSGPDQVLTDSLVTLVSGGSASSKGHPVEYQFDYGDGRRSVWLDSAITSSSWSMSGHYDVRVLARCAEHIDIFSEWSRSTGVSAAPEQISLPAQPTGTAHLCMSSRGTYSTGGAASSVGHPVEYQCDWGDGLSYWSSDNVFQHAWAAPGAYDCRARARCVLDPSVVSDWSPVQAVLVAQDRPPWAVEFDLPSLVGAYGDKGQYAAHGAVVTYNGPRAHVTGFMIETSGRGAGTTCQFDGDPTQYNVSLIAWKRLQLLDDEKGWQVEEWPAQFLTLPLSSWTDAGLWLHEGSDWTTPGILEDGDRLRVAVAPRLEDFSGCWANGFDFYELSSARLFLELECGSE